MSRFDDVEDVSFLGGITLRGLKELAIGEYRSEMARLTGREAVTVPNENKALLYAAAQIFYQAAEAVDAKARQNLLKYASGNYLDNLALGTGITRKEAEYAYVTMRFTLSAKRSRAVVIPKGTRITTQTGEIYFETIAYKEISAGEITEDIDCIASTAGAAANELDIGEINVLADPIAYVASVSNINAPEGGAEKESDDDLAERIYLARNSFSTAGSEQAYIYHTKSFSTLIDDVIVTNPADANIVIYILMKDTQEASEAFLNALKEYMEQSDIKPLTDRITVLNAKRAEFRLDVSYKIYINDLHRQSEINAAVEAAAEEYNKWQTAKIGRDINPQKLISLMIAAGAANVEVREPLPAEVTPESVARCAGVNIEYAGYIE